MRERLMTISCVLQDTRGRVKLHEDAAVHRHMLLVLRSNTHLEQQVRLTDPAEITLLLLLLLLISV